MVVYINVTLALLAFINPLSKIFIISTLSEASSPRDLFRVSLRATEIAGIILVSFTLLGSFLLTFLFQVNLYAFQIVGGVILLSRGFQALNKGLFFEVDTHQRLEDASVVPLASPLIAGPATITACISFPAQYGIFLTLLAIVSALLLNFFVMIYAQAIGDVLKKHNIMGALIRITGLIVATIGTQMMLNGLKAFIRTLAFV